MSAVQQEQVESSRRAYPVPVGEIVPNPRQPRKEFDEFALMELAASIRQYGLLQPITLRAGDGCYEIVMGERRYRACLMLGFTHIDAFILGTSPGESAVLAVVENIQRENLHYFEEAEAYGALLHQGMNLEALARKLGKSVSAVANKMRLLKLQPDVRRLLTEAGMSERHARALLALPDEASRLRIARLCADRHLTVRETEALVQKAQRRLPAAPPARRVISLARDHRLYLNAIRSLVTQLQQTGVEADMETEEKDAYLQVSIRLPKLTDHRGPAGDFPDPMLL